MSDESNPDETRAEPAAAPAAAPAPAALAVAATPSAPAALAARPVDPKQAQFNALRARVAREMQAYRGLMPAGMSADYMVATVLKAVRKTPELLQCDERSILLAVIECAGLGLTPNSELGQAHLVPYNRECKLVLGYAGLLELVRRSGQVEFVATGVIHEDDHYEYELGESPRIRVVPKLRPLGAPPARFVAAYAVARLRGAVHPNIELMDAQQVDAIRARAKGGKGWVTDFEEMARKTALRRLLKSMPKSRELNRALLLENRASDGEVVEIEQLAEELAQERGGGVDAPAHQLGDGAHEALDAAAASEPTAAQAATAALKTQLANNGRAAAARNPPARPRH